MESEEGGGRRRGRKFRGWGGGLRSQLSHQRSQEATSPKRRTQHGEITERNTALKHAANAAGSRDRTRGRDGGSVGRGNYKTPNCSYIERARNCANPEREAKTSV